MYALIQELLICRSLSPCYFVFLYEQLNLFKLKALKEGRPHHLVTIPQFLDTLAQSDFSKQNILCILYLHELVCFMNVSFNPIPYIGDVKLREFNSFVANQMIRWNASQTIQKNEEISTLWVRGEPQSPAIIINGHKRFLSSPTKIQSYDINSMS